jgi:ribonucleotide reductase alpha subunit
MTALEFPVSTEAAALNVFHGERRFSEALGREGCSCLLKLYNETIERPQHMFMRAALGIHDNDIKDAEEGVGAPPERLTMTRTAATASEALGRGGFQ